MELSGQSSYIKKEHFHIDLKGNALLNKDFNC